MSELKFIYFEGCPNAEQVRRNLEGTGYEFDEIKQDDLPAHHPFKNYSSPTILKDNLVIHGAATGAEGGCSLQVPTIEQIREKVRAMPVTKKGVALAPTGSIGSVITVILCPVCKPAIAAFLGSIGLGFFAHESVMKSILIVFLVLTVGGLLWSYLKVHRKVWPILIGTGMAIALYLGRYVYFGYTENLVLTYGSIAGLVAVSVWNLLLKRPAACGSCVKDSLK